MNRIKIHLLFILIVACQPSKKSITINRHNNDFYAELTIPLYFVDKNDKELPYRLFLPQDYNPDKKYPLILSFHGAGERGNENFQQLVPWVAAWTDNEVQKQFPSIILMPQCPSEMKWVNTPWENGSYTISNTPMSQPMELVKKVFDKTVKEYSVDVNRIYIIGASMGGYATWNFILNYPDIPAAAVPVCGAGDPSLARRIKDLPIWAFHGNKDNIVPISGTMDMVNELKMNDNNKSRITIYDNIGHEAYDIFWKESNLILWLFDQKKR